MIENFGKRLRVKIVEGKALPKEPLIPDTPKLYQNSYDFSIVLFWSIMM